MHVVLLPPRGPLAFTGGKNTPPSPDSAVPYWKFNGNLIRHSGSNEVVKPHWNY